MEIDNKNKTITAYHESGHAIIAYYTKDAMPINKATIMPRGPTLGHVSLVFLFFQIVLPRSLCRKLLMKTFQKKIQLLPRCVDTFFFNFLNCLEIRHTCEIYLLIKDILNISDNIFTLWNVIQEWQQNIILKYVVALFPSKEIMYHSDWFNSFSKFFLIEYKFHFHIFLIIDVCFYLFMF